VSGRGSYPEGDASTPFDPSVPQPARVYDAWLGGKDHYAADRETAIRVIEVRPQVIAAEPRLVQVAAEPGQRRSVLIQRSALFRFPDLVTVEFVALAPDRSSLALYSRARYGRSDFGVNRRRVLRWLSRLQQIAGAAD